MNHKILTHRAFALMMIFLLLAGCSALQSAPSPSALPPTPTPVPLTPTTAPSSTTPLPSPTPIPPTPTLLPTPDIPAPTLSALLGTQLPLNVVTDLTYTSELALDVFAPSQPGPWPIVVILHGERLTKNAVKGLSKSVAERGAVVFTPTWHSSEPAPPRDKIGKGLEDAACAIRFARAKAVNMVAIRIGFYWSAIRVEEPSERSSPSLATIFRATAL